MDVEETLNPREIRERLAGAALIDPGFRYRFRQDPKEAAASIGIDLDDAETEEIKAFLRQVDWDAVDAISPLVKAALPRMPQSANAAWG